MTVKPLRHIAVILLSGAFFTLLIWTASVCFLRNLGGIIGSLAPVFGLDTDTSRTFSEIFGQLRSAMLDLPMGIAGSVCLLFSGFAAAFLSGKPSPKAGRIVTVCVLGVMIFLLLTAVTIWFTEVNDIRFGKVMTSLVSLLNAGIL